MTPDPQTPDWVKAVGVALGLICSHLIAYTRDSRTDFAYLLLKGCSMSTNAPTSPFLTTIEAELPVVIAEFKKFAKVLLDNALTGDNAAKTAQLSAMLKPAFNAEYAKLNLPSWALGEADIIFDGIISGLVNVVEIGA